MTMREDCTTHCHKCGREFTPDEVPGRIDFKRKNRETQTTLMCEKCTYAYAQVMLTFDYCARWHNVVDVVRGV